jgi:hypothetical protein
MPVDYDRAVAFILAHGSGAELYALNELEGGDRYEVLSWSEVNQRLLDGQRPDGGWAPFWASDYSSLDATCYRLAQAEMTHLSLPQTALEFLRSQQRPDGSWEEYELVRDLAPAWAKPGDLAARLYLTANCGWWLVNTSPNVSLSDKPEYRAEATKAGVYLQQRLAPDGSLSSLLQTHWLAAALWIELIWNRSFYPFALNGAPPAMPEPAQRALDYLATRLDDETPAGALGWMLTTLAPERVPREHPAIVKAAALLGEQQRPDGGWTSEDGPERDVWVTMQALKAFYSWPAV